MRVKDLIQELQTIDEDEFIAASYYLQDAMQDLFLSDEKLSNDEWEEITDNLTYELEDFTPDTMHQFIVSELTHIRSRQKNGN